MFHIYEDGSVNKVVDGIESPAKISLTGQGKKYAMISFTLDGHQKHEYVHRLIATAFVPNPNKYPQVNHIDGNKMNNSSKNLEWVTPQMNILHAYKTGLISPYSQGKVCSVCGVKIGNGSSVNFCKDCYSKHLKSLRSQQVLQRDVIKFQFFSDRDKEIMEMWINGSTYQEIGTLIGVSRQRVHQIVKRYIDKEEDFWQT